MILLLDFQWWDMDDEDCSAWVRFSEVGINARMRNALELYALRKERGASSAPVATARELEAAGEERLPAALTGEGAGDAPGLASEDAIHDGEKLVKRA